MALTRLNSFATGSVVTNVIATGEFDNIYNNALTLISPLTGNLAAGGNLITGLGLGTVGSPTLQFTGDTNTGIFSSGADALVLAGGGLSLMTLTSTPSAGIVSINPGAISATASTNVGRLFGGGGSALTIPAGTTAIVAGVWIAEPNLTATGTITRAATAYFEDAPTEGGTANFTLWSDAGPNRFDGTCYINDEANANVTLWLTINQGANDDQILALKSSDVAHGVTAIAETDTYAALGKLDATAGGLLARGFSTAATGVYLVGTGTTANTAKTTGAAAMIRLDSRLRSGTGETGSGADANLVVISDNGTARFIFDAEGSAHADVEWIAFQDHDDVTLLKNLEREVQRRDLAEFVSPERRELEQLGLLSSDGAARGLVNTTRLSMLQTGATQQIHAVLDVLLDDLLSRRALSPQELVKIPTGIRGRKGLA